MFKVGYTESSPGVNRLAAHNRCYPEFDMVDFESMANAYRFEQVMLKEFSRERCEFRERCSSCKKIHNEWFSLEQEVLVASLKKWHRFSKSEPYDKKRLRSEVKSLPPPAREPDYEDQTCESPTPSKSARPKIPKSQVGRASKSGLPQTSGNKDTGTEQESSKDEERSEDEESSEEKSAGVSDDFRQSYCSSPPSVTPLVSKMAQLSMANKKGPKAGKKTAHTGG